ncbi:hypothetical protein OH768_05205 [Streptomyces sp. NBC_01622]|uniref:hypothetical protein n=1 Tax=Streptomyces sp. NBC_01622 TaxID=2975903 RepID=UPI00386F2BA5|nr:hypothetical protein OH768_05205 [Streptomyces sp. NBC_01622]
MLAPSVTRRLIDTLTALPTALLPDTPDAPAAPEEPALTELLTERELLVLVLVARRAALTGTM